MLRLPYSRDLSGPGYDRASLFKKNQSRVRFPLEENRVVEVSVKKIVAVLK
jgi:hypothetical protein